MQSRSKLNLLIATPTDGHGRNTRIQNLNPTSTQTSPHYSIPCRYCETHPNTITPVYASMCLPVIIAFGNGSKTIFWLETIIFFLKSSLDWLDSFVARRLNKTSKVSAAFDECGLAFNTACFQFATMLFLVNATGHPFLLIAMGLILLLNGFTFRYN